MLGFVFETTSFPTLSTRPKDKDCRESAIQTMKFIGSPRSWDEMSVYEYARNVSLCATSDDLATINVERRMQEDEKYHSSEAGAMRMRLVTEIPMFCGYTKYEQNISTYRLIKAESLDCVSKRNTLRVSTTTHDRILDAE